MKATIKAILMTRAPLHIAHPDGIRMNVKGDIEYGKNGFPCTAVQKIRIPVLSGLTEQGDKKVFSKAYPVIAGNNIAGRLRRHAANHVLKALAKKGQRVSMHAYSVLQCGASTGKPDSDEMMYLEWKAATHHAYFGLMGGGPKMFERKLRVHSATPITQALMDIKGALAHPTARDNAVSDQTQFTARWGFCRMDDLRDLANIEMAAQTIENFEIEFEKRQLLIFDEKKRQKPESMKDQSDADDSDIAVASGKSNRYSTKTYAAIEFVIPGVLFDLTMELDVATDAQVGLFLESLDSFAELERLGGYTRNGFGVFTFENIQISLESGAVVNLFNNGRLDRANSKIAAWLAAWKVEAAAMDATDIEALVAVAPKIEKSKKETKKKGVKGQEDQQPVLLESTTPP